MTRIKWIGTSLFKNEIENLVANNEIVFIAAALNFIAAECKHGLRGQADVRANRNAAHLQKFSGLRHPDAAFEGIFSYTPTPALLHLAKP